MIWTYNPFSIKEEVGNIDLYNIHNIKLLRMLDFATLYDHSIPGIPVRNSKFPERKYTLCNIHTGQAICGLKETLPLKKWQKKILFLGTRFSGETSTYFALLHLANGIKKPDSELLQLHDEIKWFNNPAIWMSDSWFVAVY